MLDALVSRYVRHMNRRLMNFGEAEGPVELPAPDPDKQYLLYLHIPFCVVLCPFCSFHRVEFQENKATQYIAALQDEIRIVTGRGGAFFVSVGASSATTTMSSNGSTFSGSSTMGPETFGTATYRRITAMAATEVSGIQT